MRTSDGRWRVEVGGLSPTVVWYRLVGLGVDRWLPSTQALMDALAAAGVDLADLDQTEASAAA
jgi:hypothetical protein